MKRPPPSNRPRRSLEMRSAEAAIKSALSFHGIANEVRAERLMTEWTDLVGAKIAARTRPFGIVDRLLVIEVASSAWLQELTLLKSQILTGLHQRFGRPHLFDDIKFRLAGRTGARPASRPPRARPSRAAPLTPTPATGLAREQIVRDVEKVDDLELRELIARVRIGNDK